MTKTINDIATSETTTFFEWPEMGEEFRSNAVIGVISIYITIN